VLVPESNPELLLPPRTRLLHIGPMKTGTTSIQGAASARRSKLLEHGVRYPGVWFNHGRQLGALMGYSVDTWKRPAPLRPDLLDVDKAGVPPARLWTDLEREIDADRERRIFITHEFVSQADDATARRIVDALGERTHVCLTLRSPGQIVPSLWAQGIRDDAQTEPFEQWLDRFYGKDPEHPMSGRFLRAYDQADLIERWAQLVGPDNITVVIVDPAQPTQLTDSFEAMLGLPAGMLTWGRTNRSLTAPEVELFRIANIELRERGADWLSYFDLVRKGAILYGAQRRKLSADEPRVALPAWAARIADQDGRDFADCIARSAVRVVGDLNALALPSRSADLPQIDQVPVDLAAPAIAAAVLAAQERRAKEAASHTCPTFTQRAGELPDGQRAGTLASNFSTRELAAALTRRLVYKLRTRKTHPTNGRAV